MASQGITLPRTRAHLLTRVQVIQPLRQGRVRRLQMRRAVAESGTEMAGLGLTDAKATFYSSLTLSELDAARKDPKMGAAERAEVDALYRDRAKAAGVTPSVNLHFLLDKLDQQKTPSTFSWSLSPSQEQQVLDEVRTGSPIYGPTSASGEAPVLAPAAPSIWSKISAGFQSFATAVTPVATAAIQYKAATDAQSLAERQAAAAKAQAEADMALAMAQANRPASSTPKWIVPVAIAGAGALVLILVMKNKK